MSNKFDEFLSEIDGIKLENGSEKDIEKLKDIFSGNIPKELLETFIEHVPAEDVEVGDFVFYGIDRIIEENKDYVPGANIYILSDCIRLLQHSMEIVFVMILIIRIIRFTNVHMSF